MSTGNFTKTPLIFFMFIISIWAVATTVDWTNEDQIMIVIIVSGLIVALIVYLLKVGRIRVK